MESRQEDLTRADAVAAVDDAEQRDETFATYLSAALRGHLALMQQLHEQNVWLCIHETLAPLTAGPRASDSSAGSRVRKATDERFWLCTLGASALHAATWSGQLHVLEFLLHQGQHPDARDQHGMTAIMLTLTRHNIQAHRMIFHRGVAVRRSTVVDTRQEDAERLSNTTALVMLFLQFDSDVNLKNSHGRTALHFATDDDTISITRVLLDNGADVNSVDESGLSPLHLAVESGSQEVIALLMVHGAAWDQEDRNGHTPLATAVIRDKAAIVQLFLDDERLAEVAHDTAFGGKLLLMAVKARSVNVVRTLIECQYSTVGFVDADGASSMHKALIDGCLAVQKALLQFDHSRLLLTLTTNQGDTCLHYVTQYGSLDEVNLMLDHHEDSHTNSAESIHDISMECQPINTLNKDGCSALLMLSSATNVYHRDKKSKALVAHGAWLFPHNLCVQMWRDVPWLLSFSTACRTCLHQYITECDSVVARGDLVALCLHWVACASFPANRGSHNFAQLLTIVLYAGYSLDVLRVLLELPFTSNRLGSFLGHLKLFADKHQHFFLQRLQHEAVRDSSHERQVGRPSVPQPGII
ncbi:TPA: hypothetical protein N0F65_003451 [Lagenidium giganteum]|uniref:Ankyrin repeat protein n=1 Tax=Lagenidium giganteum TaxID=4803 RepID=A0AAV2YH08_9STRA|nr:TPA: hypothetical protein N0F65_003451 [Lagenidium giganteum]